MEITPLLSPISLGAQSYYDSLRRFHKLPEAEETPWLPPPPESNFRIDDLLDFSNESVCGFEEYAEEDEEEEEEEEDEEEGKEGGGGSDRFWTSMPPGLSSHSCALWE